MGFSSLRDELPEFRRNALEVIGSCRIDRHRNGSDSRPLCDRHRDRRGVGMEELLRRIIAQGRKGAVRLQERISFDATGLRKAQ